MLTRAVMFCPQTDLEPAVSLILLSVLDKLQDDGAIVACVVLHTVWEVNGADTA